jgi:hypothetical protein
MRITIFVAVVLSLGVCALAQETASPQLQLRIISNKDIYTLNEKVMVKGEFTNLTSKMLCFPVPDQSGCPNAGVGAFRTVGEATETGEHDRAPMACNTNVRGVVGAELDSAIKNNWIKLPPNAVYVTNAAEATVKLSEVGKWRLTASYRPPENSYSLPHDYKKLLESAAEKAGCTLPRSETSEPSFITARAAGAER